MECLTIKKTERRNKMNWKKLLIDVLKVVVGAVAGWLGNGLI